MIQSNNKDDRDEFIALKYEEESNCKYCLNIPFCIHKPILNIEIICESDDGKETIFVIL